MSTQHNDLLSLNSLMPIFDEYLTKLSNQWQEYQDGTVNVISTDMAQNYHQLSGAMTMVNLSLFANLSSALSLLSLRIRSYSVKDDDDDHAEIKDLVAIAYTSHYLLQVELEKYFSSGYYHQFLLITSINNISGLLADDKLTIDVNKIHSYIDNNESLVKAIELPDDSNTHIELTEAQQSKIREAWFHHKDRLIANHAERDQSIKQLHKMSSFIWRSCKTPLLQGLWYLSYLWLGCLEINTATDSNKYSKLLNQLTDVLQTMLDSDDTDEELTDTEIATYELLVAELYVQLNVFDEIDEITQKAINVLQSTYLKRYEFFNNILHSLVQILLELPTVENFSKPINYLTDIRQKLARRGWVIYVAYLDLILTDLDKLQSAEEDDETELRWQVEKQIQDLYAGIFKMRQGITIDTAKITQQDLAIPQQKSECPLLREIRIDVEKLKKHFRNYTQTRDLASLPSEDFFDQMRDNLLELKLSKVVFVLGQMASLINRFHREQLHQVSWVVLGATVDSISEFELFFDYMAQEMLDLDRLKLVSERITQADSLINYFLQEQDAILPISDDEKVIDNTVVRYSDGGEIKPADEDDDGTDETESLESTPVEVVSDEQEKVVVKDNSALEEARQSLKEDNFDMDEEIREIFEEEVADVLETIDEQYAVWKNEHNNIEALTDIRRSFHTLKGSGRMVGANNLGEMAWSVESLLNRVLDKKVEITPVLVSFIADVREQIPPLLTDFINKQKPTVEPATIIAQANNLLKGVDINEGIDLHSDDTNLEEVAEQPLSDQPDEEQQEQVEQTAEITIPDVLQPFLDEAENLPADTSDMDEDIREIFIEEADEVLQEILPLFYQWSNNTTDIESLTDIRRGFHTLKGSGRMVGANRSGELAWSIENMLNRVLDNTIEIEKGMLALIHDVLQSYPQLVEVFNAKSTQYPAVLPFWVACGHAYSKKLGKEFDYSTLLSLFLTDEQMAEHKGFADAIDVTTEEPRETIVSELQRASEDSQVLNTIRKINTQLSDSLTDEEKQFSEAEQEFIDVFISEAQEHLIAVKDFINANSEQENVAVDDAIVRSFHTLRGASNFEPLEIISDASKAIEESLVYLQHHEQGFSKEQLKALSNSVSLMARHLDIDESVIALHDADDMAEATETLCHTIVQDSLNIQEIITGIDDLLDSEHDLASHLQGNQESIIEYIELLISQIKLLQSRTTESKSFQNLLTPIGQVYQKLIEQPEWIKDNNIIEALNLANEQLIRLFDSLAGSMSMKVDEEVIETLNIILAHLEKSEDDVQAVVEPSKPVQKAELIFEEVETDKELLEIFLEEAHELEMDISQSFSHWASDPNDLNPLKELQRHLHTIKGGSRMAGLSSIGDLTHEMETVYEKFVNQEMIPSMAWLDVMQKAQDLLSTQIEYLEENHRSFFAHELITQLHTFIDLKQPPADVHLIIPNVDGELIEEVAEDESFEPVEEATAKKKDKDKDIGVSFDKLKLDSWGGTLPDIDILNVFLEEAEELMESTALHLQSFKEDTSDLISLQELQRELHTIKGGARMVGSDSIADLSHEMETVYEGLCNHHLPANEKIIDLLINSHDWLATSVHVLSHSINPPKPTQLIDSLQQFHYSPDSLVEVPVVSLFEYQEAIAEYEEYLSQLQVVHDISSMPVMEGDFGEFKEVTDLNSEAIRVPANVMEKMINLSGESVINRARVDMGISGLTNNIEEMGTTVHRLADQLRRMDAELEEQILSQIEDDNLLESENFDPLEMDQYSSLNQLSKALSESASDLVDIKATLLERVRDSENLLLQLARTQAELQDSLMNSRMVPFSRLTPRLQRVVRQTANEVNKQVELTVINADGEMDRSILERITSPLEHMLRNAVDHGIENREDRAKAGKSEVGKVTLSISREGSELVIQLSDDGHGIDVQSVRNKAIKQGLIDPNDESLTDADIMQYIFNAGLSTTKKVTQISGRGVGMDVVRSEIRQLGGAVSVDSVKGQGSRFVMRVPLTVAVSDALVVRAADTHYVIPLVQIERVEQVNPDELFAYYQSDNNTFTISEVDYRLRYLNEILTGNTVNDLAVSGNSSLPVIIIKNQTGQNLALQVDEIVGSRMEVVVKPLGKQLSHVSGVSAATIMGDGSIMLILDLIALIRNAPIRQVSTIEQQPLMDERKKILVIDDSVTVRKVTSRFLEREGFDAHVAKDGVDALKILQEFTPDLILLDIEMPRMDGFEVATQIRHNDRLREIPIIMITSRTGDKHRERAREIGVNDYLGKPFQELILLKSISNLLGLNLVFTEEDENRL